MVSFSDIRQGDQGTLLQDNPVVDNNDVATGQNWVKCTSGAVTDAVMTASNTVRTGSATDFSLYRIPVASPTADEPAREEVFIANAPTSARYMVCIRMTESGSAFYGASLEVSGSSLATRVWKRTGGGSITGLGSSVSLGALSGFVGTAPVLECRAAGTSISTVVNGVVRATVTDLDITDAGYTGIRITGPAADGEGFQGRHFEAGAPDPPNIETPSDLPDAFQGEAYSVTLQARGGALPLTWSVVSGVLPAGLSLSSAGVISGTPTTIENQTFTVVVEDDLNQTDSQQYSIDVSAAVFGIRRLDVWPNIDQILVGAKYGGDPTHASTVQFWFKRTSEPDQNWSLASGGWRKSLRPWRVKDTGDGFGDYHYAVCWDLQSNTSYDIKATLSLAGETDDTEIVSVATFISPTWTHADIIAQATRFVSVNGSNSNDGLSWATAWRDLDQAMIAAPTGAVVGVDVGAYKRPTTSRTGTITLCGRFAPVSFISLADRSEWDPDDMEAAVVNSGQHTIIYAERSTPTGSGKDNVAPWVLNTLTPANGTPATRQAWQWISAPAAFAGAGGVCFSQTEQGLVTRLPSWNNKSGVTEAPAGSGSTYTLTSAAEFRKMVEDNLDINYGIYRVSDASRDFTLYEPAMDAAGGPNGHYLWFIPQTNGGWTLSTDNIRVVGMHFKSCPVVISHTCDFPTVSDCMFENCNVSFSGSKSATPDAYGVGPLVQRSYFRDTRLWSDDAGNERIIPWRSIKEKIHLPSGITYITPQVVSAETTGPKQNGGSLSATVRECDIDGCFNGTGAYSAGFDRFCSGFNYSFRNNRVRRYSDDGVEMEGWGKRAGPIGVVISDSVFSDGAVLYSTGPQNGGPLYFLFNRGFRLGRQGCGREYNGSTGGSAQLHKWRGADTDPVEGNGQPAMIYEAHCTYLPFDPPYQVGMNGGGPFGSGSSSAATCNRFVIFNCVWDMQRYIMECPDVLPGETWIEDYNAWSNNDPTRGIDFNGDRLSLASYRTASGQGAHTNTLGGVDLDWLDARAVILAALSNPSANDLRPIGVLANSGTPLDNASDREGVDYPVGSAPSRGWYVRGAEPPPQEPSSTFFLTRYVLARRRM